MAARLIQAIACLREAYSGRADLLAVAQVLGEMSEVMLRQLLLRPVQDCGLRGSLRAGAELTVSSACRASASGCDGSRPGWTPGRRRQLATFLESSMHEPPSAGR